VGAPAQGEKPKRGVSCSFCGKPGHDVTTCKRKQHVNRISQSTKSKSSSSRSTSPVNRGKDKRSAVERSLHQERVQHQEANRARIERRLEEAEAARAEAQQALERQQDPFIRLITIIDNNEELFAGILARHPMGGVSTVDGMRRYVLDLQALDAKDAARGLFNLAMGMLSGREGEIPEEAGWALPEVYEEEKEVLVFRPGRIPQYQAISAVLGVGTLSYVLSRIVFYPMNKLMSVDYPITPLNISYAVKECIFEYVDRRLTTVGAMLTAAFYYLSTRKTPLWTTITLRHEFEYDPLPPDEQVRLSADRRNMTFRAAQVMESSFGMRVNHVVSAFEEVENFGVGRFFKRGGKFGSTVRHIVDRIWWAQPPHDRTLVPIPAGTVLWNPDCERSLMVADQMHPGEVRNRLLDTLPSVNNDVIDLTLYHWLARSPDVMEPNGDFQEKFRNVRRSLKTNGSVANDLRPAIYAMLYPSTAHVIMIQWLWARTRSSGRTQATQDWGL